MGNNKVVCLKNDQNDAVCELVQGGQSQGAAGDHSAVGGMRREAGNGHVSFSQGTDSPSEYLTYTLNKEEPDSGTLKKSKAPERTIGKPGAAGLTEQHRGWTCSSDDQSGPHSKPG